MNPNFKTITIPVGRLPAGGQGGDFGAPAEAGVSGLPERVLQASPGAGPVQQLIRAREGYRGLRPPQRHADQGGPPHKDGALWHRPHRGPGSSVNSLLKLALVLSHQIST